ncbi:MAG: Flp pilus assembly protein CpaB [Bryobacter sp.]|nr:Flp pilus assembly protein CpaB [Bryobacter sp.]
MDRQKLLLIFGGAWVSAALLTWFLYAQTVGKRAESLETVYAAAREMPAGTRLGKNDIKAVRIPAKDIPTGSFREPKELLNRALMIPVSMNEPITARKLATLSGIDGVGAIIPAGKRAVAVQITEFSGAALLIQPRSHVDVIVSRTGSLSEAVSTVVLQNLEVLSVGRVTDLLQAADPKTAQANLQVRPGTQLAVTLLVTPEEASKLELAKNNGRISLALRNPADTQNLAEPPMTTGEVIDPTMGDRRARLAARMRAGQNVDPALLKTLNDDKAWTQMTGKAPVSAPAGGAGKPGTAKAAEKSADKERQHVVDVFRGEKHVQEVFTVPDGKQPK